MCITSEHDVSSLFSTLLYLAFKSSKSALNRLLYVRLYYICNLLVILLLVAADNVEMEIVLPGDMTVRESHDIALELQHKIEGLEEVERAFVHVSLDLVS